MNLTQGKDKQSRKERVFNQREQDILAAALCSFHSDQWESVTMAQIADKVGIAKGTMYLHFASKHEIYAQLALDFYQSLLIRLREPLTGNAADRFRKLVYRAFDFHLQRPAYRRVAQYCEREDFKSSLKPEITDKLNKTDTDIEHIISGLLKLGVEEGVFKPVAAGDLLLGLRCTFQGALTRFWSNKNEEHTNPDRFITSITNYMLATIETQTERIPSPSGSTTINNPTTIKQQRVHSEDLEFNS